MKKTFLSIAGVLALSVMLVSCGGGSPKATAEKFLNGFYHMDYNAARQVADSETRKQLESWESIMGSMVNKDAKALAQKIKVTVKEPKVLTDSTATVEYITDKDETPRTLKMIKQKGQWLAQWSKMEMGSGMGGDMNGGTAPGTPGPDMAPDTTMAPAADPMPEGAGGTMNGTEDKSGAGNTTDGGTMTPPAGTGTQR